MKEYHEHSNHPDYKFNVEVKSLWTDSGRPTESHIYIVNAFEPEIHALIYCDNSIAITMYEHCYAMWSLHDGKCIGGNLWEKDKWTLTGESVEKIRELMRK